jgi:class 3 adenylate cyclase
VRLACQARVNGSATVRRMVVDTDDARIVDASVSGEVPTLIERPVVVLSATLRHARAFAAQNLSYDVAHVLQRFYRQLHEPVAANHGKVVSFDGECLVAVFGSGDGSTAEAALEAVRAAVRMQTRMRPLNRYLGQHYGCAFDLGVGIHAGPALVGAVGESGGALEVTIGPTMAIARDLEGVARPKGAHIVATHAVIALIGGDLRLGRAVEPVDDASATPLPVHEVLDFQKPDTVYLVQSTLEHVVLRADDFARLFYDRLFDQNPEIVPLFDHVDMNIQRSMLMNVLAVTVRGLDRIHELVPTIQDLARRHVQYGVEVRHYRAVGQALLWALETFFGDAFTPEVHLAWTEVYGTLARTMIEATRPAVVAS